MFALGSLVIALLIAWILVLSPGALFSLRPPLNSEGFEEIEPGMSKSEVEALMGGPPGDYGDYRADTGSQTLEGFFCPPESRSFKLPTGLTWLDDDEKFEVCFDTAGYVVAKHERSEYGRPTGVLARIRSLFVL